MNYFKKTLCLFSLFMLPICCFAEPDPFDEDAEDVPIDGGISMLVAAGIGYGIKKMYKKNTDNNDSNYGNK